VPKLYTGPAISHFQYMANLYLTSVAASHFISKMSMDRAVEATYELADQYPDWWKDEVGSTAPIEFADERTLVQIARDYRRVARFYGDIGCVLLPSGHDEPFFATERYEALPRSGKKPLVEIDFSAGAAPAPDIERALEPAFEPEAKTGSLIVLQRGKCLYERYAGGAGADTKLASWSMGKSLVSALIGTLMTEGKTELDRSDLLACWTSDAGDPRRKILLRDLLRMSSGLRFSGYENPAYTWGQATSDHLLPYSEAIEFYSLSTSMPLEHAPGTVGRYRNCDIASAAAVAKQIVESEGGDFVHWVYDKLNPILGDGQFCLCPDAHGNPIFTGLTYVTARGWARFAQLMLDGGRAGTQRIFDENYVQFAQQVAPAWVGADSSWHRATYGGGFWVNQQRDDRPAEFDLPADAYFAAGGGSNYAIIVPSLDLVVVRQGDLRGRGGKDHLNAALRELVPLLSGAT